MPEYVVVRTTITVANVSVVADNKKDALDKALHQGRLIKHPTNSHSIRTSNAERIS